MPAMNPDGLSYNVRGIPEAEVDLNRLYPGKRTGYIAERITAKIWEVAKKHDAIIDFHTMGPSIPFVLTDLTGGELKKKMDKLAESTGITVLEELSADEYALQNLGASLGGVATAAGIPNITIELSGSKGVDWSNVEAGFLSAKNVLVNMGIIKGTHTRVTSVPVIRAKGFRRDDVFAGKPGIIEYAIKMGDSVRKGATLARIRNVFGETVEEVKMPEDGYMVSENLSHSVWTGSYVACIAVKVK
jgi:predicted deacylase